MTPTATAPTASRRHRPSRLRDEPTVARRDRHRTTATLAAYRAESGAQRELVSRAGARGTVLVIDRDSLTRCDERLVAHLGADEPSHNAHVVCELYVADVVGARVRLPRPLCTTDLTAVPFATVAPVARRRAATRAHEPSCRESTLVDAGGFVHRIERVRATGTDAPELRWMRHPPAGHAGPAQMVTVRDVIGAMESYEPAREISRRAALRWRRHPHTSVAALIAELSRLAASRIVLNRGVREALVEVATRDELSLSEIAARCGRIKCDRRGRMAGETSWLARRVGLMAEGGEARATPWIHSDVLALIVREGLGMAPYEVELG